MAKPINEAGHLFLFIYLLIFGIAFISLSSLYLINLNTFDRSRLCKQSLFTVVFPKEPPKTVCKGHVTAWKALSITGIVYGALTIFAASCQLWRTCRPRSPPTKSSDIKGSTCLQLFNSFCSFIVGVNVWLLSPGIPPFLALSLLKSEAVWMEGEKQDEMIYFSALALFIMCLLNFSVVVVTCVAFCMEKGNQQDDRINVYKSFEAWNPPSQTAST